MSGAAHGYSSRVDAVVDVNSVDRVCERVHSL
jgi:hypothetical protein